MRWNSPQPVELCGEHAHHGGDPVDVDDVRDRLQHVEVEEGLPGDGAVQPGLDKRGPVLLQNSLGPAHVVLAYASHSGIYRLGKRAGRRRVKIMKKTGFLYPRKALQAALHRNLKRRPCRGSLSYSRMRNRKCSPH